MKTLKSEEAITVLEDMKIDIPIPKATVTQIKRNVALNMAIDALLRRSEISNDSDTISRQDAIKTINNVRDVCDTESLDDYRDLLVECFEVLPSAQLERNGKWIKEYEGWFTDYPYKCTNCGKYSRARYHFCPNCGADMRDEKNNV